MHHPDIHELTHNIELWTLGVYLIERQKHLHCLTEVEAQQAIHKLAAKAQQEIPENVLRQMHIVSIARGGFFVVGRLAYLLGCSRRQFVDDGESAVCIIDDCALTGKRFKETLRRFNGRDVWFCHLASPQLLKDAILKEETSVKGCISVINLELIAELEPEGFSGEERYINRSVAHVAFPWTEPSLPVQIDGKIIDGWRLLPPHKVLGNSAMLGLPPLAGALEPELQLGGKVVWRLLPDGGVRLYRAGDEGMVELHNLTAAVWCGCVGYRNRGAVFEWLMNTRNDFDLKVVEHLIDLLLARGLLIQI